MPYNAGEISDKFSRQRANWTPKLLSSESIVKPSRCHEKSVDDTTVFDRVFPNVAANLRRARDSELLAPGDLLLRGEKTRAR